MRDEQALNREIQDAAELYMREAENESINSMTRERRTNNNESQQLVLVRQEYSQIRAPISRLSITRENQRPQEPEPRNRADGEDSDSDNLFLQRLTSLRNRGPTPNPLRETQTIRVKSVSSVTVQDYLKQIPKIWQEELLDPTNDTQIAAALIDECGPLTLLIYLRILALSSEYFEFKQLNSIFLTGAACLQKKRRQ